MYLASIIFFPPVLLIALGQLEWTYYFHTLISTAVSGLFVWPLGGWLFGFTLQLMLDKKGDPNLHLTFDPEGNLVSGLLERQADESPNQ
jgi:hypothetical protein